jgi:hypothetical protein
MLTHLTRISSNAKTGPIPVSTSSAETCPPSCPFKHKGCYAKNGPLALHWAKITSGNRGLNWESFCDEISRLPRGQLWRHNQAGDLPGEGEYIDASALGQLTKANTGRKGWTYTHKYGTESNREAIRSANAKGFTVNLSANSLAHADELADTDCGPVCVVLPSDQKTNTVTPAGRKVVICPATKRDCVTCATCGLCQKQRGAIVAFPAHGTAHKTVSTIVSN